LLDVNKFGLTFFFFVDDELGEESSMNIDAQRRPWCPSKKQVFGGSCGNDGAQQCLNNLLSTWDPSVRLSPVSCNCTPQPNNNILCSCPNMICP